jgi:hypothetical protein
MKVQLRLAKDGTALYEGPYDIRDADSFGRACADVWEKLQAQKFSKATSIGALFDTLDEEMIDELDGANITIGRL